MGQACTSDETVSAEGIPVTDYSTPAPVTAPGSPQPWSSVSMRMKDDDASEASEVQQFPTQRGGGRNLSRVVSGRRRSDTDDGLYPLAIGRANSEPPVSPQMIAGTTAAFPLGQDEEDDIEEEGPLTPVGPISSTLILSWISDTSTAALEVDVTGEHGSGADNQEELAHRRFNHLGHGYTHFEDNAQALLAEAKRDLAAEKKRLQVARAAEQKGLRRKPLGLMERISLALTGRA